MEDTFYCHSCGKYKKVSVHTGTGQCVSCAEKAKHYVTHEKDRLRLNRNQARRYKNERALTKTVKFLTKDD